MDDYDAIVYDLDGTLVRLDVDWGAVTQEAVTVYREAGVDPPTGDLWTLLDDAEAHGVGEAVAGLVCRREREGARRSERLFLADDLRERAGDGVPVGVCSLNCEDAVRIALSEHELAGSVTEEAIVGRDTLATRKPDPEPLRSTCRALQVDPGRTLFVGDSPRDEQTAERAGAGFVYVSELEGTLP
ncbi:phosphoglycolate phosphatase [Halalkaliarchaeum desulfuricum]|uniref:Phosphoglycolate phosphatase n=1 Tax=Halalkaliarchaeum desulfuricum TaxID=2055893 RepID=A0A343TGD7_9EURY|nr:HAD family hydrolase [Halalkaliarchaeum desulfuricum]AUX08159.1 phosphoglycolate phosphatase [Halalkaliarchaeum desulfuricum]